MEQRAAFMQVEVMPAIAELWTLSPTPDAGVNCMTCHGPAAQEGDFTMPSAALPVLNPADEFAAHQDDAAWLQFMGAQLTPKMTELLAVEPYNMETHQGFGCFSCHTMAGA